MTIHIPGGSRRPDRYPPCEKCGSENVARIVYGLPIGDSFYDARVFGDMVFGGCMLRGDRKILHCKDCSHRWNPRIETDEPNAQPDSFRDRLQLMSEREEKATSEYYRDRHVRRHGFRASAMGEFEIDCWGRKHIVILTGDGQLAFPDHPEGVLAYPDDKDMSCMKLLGMWRRDKLDEMTPIEIARVHRLLRTRAKLRPVNEWDDWLLRPISSRLHAEDQRAIQLAYGILKDCLTENLSELKEDYRLWLVVKSRTLNFVRTAMFDRRLKVNIGLHNSRRWLSRVHNKGWAVLGGHFIFEVKEVISEDRMRVLALRKTAPFQLAIEEAVAVRDEEWRLNFESGS